MKNRDYNKPWHWKPGAREKEIHFYARMRESYARKKVAEKYRLTQERVRQLENLMKRYAASGQSG